MNPSVDMVADVSDPGIALVPMATYPQHVNVSYQLGILCISMWNVSHNGSTTLLESALHAIKDRISSMDFAMANV